MNEQGTAIVTGGGKRVGADIVKALLERGWTVIAHVHKPEDEVAAAAHKAAADLSDVDCAARILAAAEGLPPVRLLVNNAARFAWDGFGEFSSEELDEHMHVNLRAPLLLTEALASRHKDGDALVVNILDAKLCAPNPDYLSYTLSKQALAGLTELSARALAAKGIRVNAIAPSLMLRSPGQTDANFRAMHERNPLGRGVTSQHVIAAIDYLVAATAVTGEMLTIDSGQRFEPPERDVQFLES